MCVHVHDNWRYSLTWRLLFAVVMYTTNKGFSYTVHLCLTVKPLVHEALGGYSYTVQLFLLNINVLCRRTSMYNRSTTEVQVPSASCTRGLRHFAMSRLWDECLWEVFLHHLIYLVCNNSLTWRAVFTFCGLGQFKILDSRFILEFWDSI